MRRSHFTYINLTGAQLQSSAGNDAVCPGQSVTFTCTVDSNSVHEWAIMDGSTTMSIDFVTPSVPNATNLGFTLTVLDVTAAPITSTATVTITSDLNGTVIVCSNALVGNNRLEQTTTVNVIGELIRPGVCIEEGSGREGRSTDCIEIDGILMADLLLVLAAF